MCFLVRDRQKRCLPFSALDLSALHTNSWRDGENLSLFWFDVSSAANYLAFTPTGKNLVAVGWAGPFLVIDTSNWSIVNKVAAREMRTHGHALTPDGKTLVVASLVSGSKIQLWNVEDVGGVG